MIAYRCGVGRRYVTIVPGSEPEPQRDITSQVYIVEPDALVHLIALVDEGALMLRIADMLSLHAAGEPHYLMQEVDTYTHRDTMVHATLGR